MAIITKDKIAEFKQKIFTDIVSHIMGTNAGVLSVIKSENLDKDEVVIEAMNEISRKLFTLSIFSGYILNATDVSVIATISKGKIILFEGGKAKEIDFNGICDLLIDQKQKQKNRRK